MSLNIFAAYLQKYFFLLAKITVVVDFSDIFFKKKNENILVECIESHIVGRWFVLEDPVQTTL